MTEPGAPWNVTARQVSSDSINVTWLVPARENGIISHYTVYYRNDNITGSAELNETVFDNKTSITITRLDPFTVYAVQVTATTGAGEGNRSLIVREQTDESSIVLCISRHCAQLVVNECFCFSLFYSSRRTH